MTLPGRKRPHRVKAAVPSILGTGPSPVFQDTSVVCHRERDEDPLPHAPPTILGVLPSILEDPPLLGGKSYVVFWLVHFDG